MKRVSFVALCMVALAVVVVFLGETHTAEAATCSLTELTPCAPAYVSGSPPSTQCCTKLKEQEPCFCEYLKDPSLKQYINNPNAKRIASTCGVTYPNC
ncbi:hypothetical protein COLO4_09369 [Corchorus olitorius]|uniref:Bifunctional inhibitor/plant lipid transfer protein/seed storage helical domain-containing protein n=1 Tax=Corchorus olitorius TaxID=93759 RepID=A0A1R3KCA7_9ROSI|nr:hypothetical protein COLO4_09369 [Corchorus olitorius]